MMTQDKIELTAMPTPNPNTVKFLVNQSLFKSGTFDYADAESAKDIPLAAALFELDNVNGVMIGFNFISVTKSEDTQWEGLLEPVRDLIIDQLDNNENALPKELLKDNSAHTEASDDVSKRIIEILDTEIRPAVAMDGGDIIFRSFQDGVVTLQLQGACSNCPSSTMTLKMGVENRLKSEFPDEITDVVQEL